jgi:hypothetical protein
MAIDGKSPTDRLNNLQDIESDGFEDLLVKALFVPVIAFFTAAGATIDAGANVFIKTFDGLATGFSNFAETLLTAPASILSGSAEASVQSMTQGIWDVFGPFSFVIGVVVIVAAWRIINSQTEDEETGNLIPFFPADVPILGNEEEEE